MLPARHRLRTSADFTSAVRGPGAKRAGGRLIVVHVNQTDARADLVIERGDSSLHLREVEHHQADALRGVVVQLASDVPAFVILGA